MTHKNKTKKLIILITLTIILFFVFSVYFKFPLKLFVEDYFNFKCPALPDGSMPSCDVMPTLSFLNLIISIAIWFFVSFMITFIVFKIVGKNHKSKS